MNKNLLKSLIVSALLATAKLGATFNRNVTAPHLAVQPIRTRHRGGYSTGIKGVANTNNTSYGASLKAHFDAKRVQP